MAFSPRTSRALLALSILTLGMAMPSIAFAEVIESSVEQLAVQPGTELVGLDDFTMIAVSWTGATT
ncbi:MAG TPA: hypothetical protein PLP95_10685, partial [Microthrixaceae bacterium]|nr:hypothetical protein [Microthrixaceae bacterium]